MPKAVDLIGKRFGRLIVVARDPNYIDNGGHNRFTWKCICDCGNEVHTATNALTHGYVKSCGCYKKDIVSETMSKDITGKRFGRLVALHRAADSGKLKYSWVCKCDCGNIVTVVGGSLTYGSTLSCGCLQHERSMEANTTHGLYKHRLYKLHDSMIKRCYDKTDKHYNSYGGRGIYVCDEWHNPNVSTNELRKMGNPYFINFYNWAYENGFYDQPKDIDKKDKLTIDRIDNDGPYAPWNCRWVTQKVQNYNKRTNVRYTINGETLTLDEIFKKYDVTQSYFDNKRELWDKWAIEYGVEHPELGLHRFDGVYYDKDGFTTLIPTKEMKEKLKEKEDT